MRRLGGHGPAKYPTGTRLGTSDGRGWKGLLAERWSHLEGELGEVQVRDTEVIVMLQGRLPIRRRGDGQEQHGNAVPGTIWLDPAGVQEDMIHLYGEVRESLHLFLPALPLSRTALREMDVDPSKVSLRYDGGFRDPLIEQIARTIHAEMLDPAPAGKMLAETLASALGVHILQHHSNLKSASVSLPVARGALDPRRLQRVKDLIDTHPGQDLTIETLAKEASRALSISPAPSRRRPGWRPIATSRTAGSKKRSLGSRKDGSRSLKSPIGAGFPPRPTSRSGSSASSAPPRGSIERPTADQVALATNTSRRAGKGPPVFRPASTAAGWRQAHFKSPSMVVSNGVSGSGAFAPRCRLSTSHTVVARGEPRQMRRVGPTNAACSLLSTLMVNDTSAPDLAAATLGIVNSLARFGMCAFEQMKFMINGMDGPEWIAFGSMLAAGIAAVAICRNTRLMRQMYTLAVAEQQRTQPAIQIYLADSRFLHQPIAQRRIYMFRLVITNQSLVANSIKQLSLAVEYDERGEPLSNVAIPHDSSAASAAKIVSAEVFRVPSPIAAGESVAGTALFPIANALLGDSVVNSHTVLVLDAHDRETRCQAIVLREIKS